MKKESSVPVFPVRLALLAGALFSLMTSSCAPGSPNPTGFQFIANTLRVPASVAEVSSSSLDIDGDADTDNKLGQALVNFITIGVDLQPALDAALADGTIIQLIDLDTTAPSDDTDVPTLVCTGTDGDQPDNAGDNFSGSDTFIVDSASAGSPLPGAINAGTLEAGPGSIPLLLAAADGTPFTLHLVGARIEAGVSVSGMSSGIVAGGIPEDEVSSLLLPAVHQAIVAIVARDCPGGVPEPGSPGEYLLSQYDDDVDGAITLDEFRNDPGVQAMFASDLDLLDDAGQFAPNMNGVMESLSLGFMFTAVRAVFDLP